MKNNFCGLLIAGGVFVVIGLLFTWAGWQLGQQADELAQLPMFDAAALESAAAGAAGVIEGQIAERNPLQFRTFVAYIREQYQGEDCDDDGCDSIWGEQERVAPSLWLDLPGGRARIVNAGYAMQNPPSTWESTERRVAYETLRYRGFGLGDAVFAVGRVAPADGGPAFQADSLYSGARDAQAASDRTGGRIFFCLGVVFSLLGGGLLGWLGVRAVR